ncbi:CPBP family intramembrane glutamic endopeptidase [Flavobacterium sp.]|uniref:CPBP family intramembrane glutamic endopeptidase n=1 Tax=Flavobacterium sp. TaxID=239 RepID=UPI002620D030|nr:CPBP family intramembrane glutamic endopeptidase [Flavobacterium sp.]
MFIQQGIKKENEFWKYIVGSIVVIFASFIGQIPLGIALLIKGLDDGKMPKTTQEILQLLEPNVFLFLMLISFAFALGALYFWVKYFHKQSFLSVTTSRSKVDWSRVFFAFGIWTLFTIASTVLAVYLEPNELVWNFKPVPFLILFIIGVVLIPIQTSTEEYIFRGYLMQGFANGSLQKKFIIGIFYSLLFVPIYLLFEFLIEKLFAIQLFFLLQIFVTILTILVIFFIDLALTKLNFFESFFYNRLYERSKSKLTPLLITSLIFGGMHYFNPEVEKMGNVIMIYYIGTGLFLGIITLMDDGMELALGFHAANNLVGALLVTSDWSALQTHSVFKDVSQPSAGFDVLVPVLIVFPILLLVFGKKYNWHNWKEKLTGEIKNDLTLKTQKNE